MKKKGSSARTGKRHLKCVQFGLILDQKYLPFGVEPPSGSTTHVQTVLRVCRDFSGDKSVVRCLLKQLPKLLKSPAEPLYLGGVVRHAQSWTLTCVVQRNVMVARYLASQTLVREGERLPAALREAVVWGGKPCTLCRYA